MTIAIYWFTYLFISYVNFEQSTLKSARWAWSGNMLSFFKELHLFIENIPLWVTLQNCTFLLQFDITWLDFLVRFDKEKETFHFWKLFRVNWIVQWCFFFVAFICLLNRKFLPTFRYFFYASLSIYLYLLYLYCFSTATTTLVIKIFINIFMAQSKITVSYFFNSANGLWV